MPQDEGKLEYHIPAQYTQDRPPINYTHITESMPISQHPRGAQLPRPNGKLQAFEGFRAFSETFSNTTVLEDWIYSDKAQLGLHIENFEDATLVTITWMHTLLDAMGRHALLRAWQAVLEGREGDVPDFVGYDSNPLASLGDEKTSGEDYVWKDRMLGRLGMARFIFNFVWESYWYPVEEGRILCMPASYFAKIKAEAFADLDSLDPAHLTYDTRNANDKSKPFLSDGDIITAWFMRLIARTHPDISASPTRTISLMNVFGMRDLLRTTSPPLLPKEGAYINNCASAIVSLFTAGDFLARPLGHIAAQIRKDLATQGTRAQIEAIQALSRANGGMALYGSGDMALCTMTNWGKAKLFETDFGAAVVGGKSQGASAKPRLILANATTSKGLMVRGSGNCVGTDPDGNIWMGTMVRKELMKGFTEAVEAMN
jgi:hypothetical protein